MHINESTALQYYSPPDGPLTRWNRTYTCPRRVYRTTTSFRKVTRQPLDYIKRKQPRFRIRRVNILAINLHKHCHCAQSPHNELQLLMHGHKPWRGSNHRPSVLFGHHHLLGGLHMRKRSKEVGCSSLLVWLTVGFHPSASLLIPTSRDERGLAKISAASC